MSEKITSKSSNQILSSSSSKAAVETNLGETKLRGHLHQNPSKSVENTSLIKGRKNVDKKQGKKSNNVDNNNEAAAAPAAKLNEFKTAESGPTGYGYDSLLRNWQAANNNRSNNQQKQQQQQRLQEGYEDGGGLATTDPTPTESVIGGSGGSSGNKHNRFQAKYDDLQCRRQSAGDGPQPLIGDENADANNNYADHNRRFTLTELNELKAVSRKPGTGLLWKQAAVLKGKCPKLHPWHRTVLICACYTNSLSLGFICRCMYLYGAPFFLLYTLVKIVIGFPMLLMGLILFQYGHVGPFKLFQRLAPAWLGISILYLIYMFVQLMAASELLTTSLVHLSMSLITGGSYRHCPQAALEMVRNKREENNFIVSTDAGASTSKLLNSFHSNLSQQQQDLRQQQFRIQRNSAAPNGLVGNKNHKKNAIPDGVFDPVPPESSIGIATKYRAPPCMDALHYQACVQRPKISIKAPRSPSYPGYFAKGYCYRTFREFYKERIAHCLEQPGPDLDPSILSPTIDDRKKFQWSSFNADANRHSECSFQLFFNNDINKIVFFSTITNETEFLYKTKQLHKKKTGIDTEKSNKWEVLYKEGPPFKEMFQHLFTIENRNTGRFMYPVDFRKINDDLLLHNDNDLVLTIDLRHFWHPYQLQTVANRARLIRLWWNLTIDHQLELKKSKSITRSKNDGKSAEVYVVDKMVKMGAIEWLLQHTMITADGKQGNKCTPTSEAKQKQRNNGRGGRKGDEDTSDICQNRRVNMDERHVSERFIVNVFGDVSLTGFGGPIRVSWQYSLALFVGYLLIGLLLIVFGLDRILIIVVYAFIIGVFFLIFIMFCLLINWNFSSWGIGQVMTNFDLDPFQDFKFWRDLLCAGCLLPTSYFVTIPIAARHGSHDSELFFRAAFTVFINLIVSLFYVIVGAQFLGWLSGAVGEGIAESLRKAADYREHVVYHVILIVGSSYKFGFLLSGVFLLVNILLLLGCMTAIFWVLLNSLVEHCPFQRFVDSSIYRLKIGKFIPHKMQAAIALEFVILFIFALCLLITNYGRHAIHAGAMPWLCYSAGPILIFFIHIGVVWVYGWRNWIADVGSCIGGTKDNLMVRQIRNSVKEMTDDSCRGGEVRNKNKDRGGIEGGISEAEFSLARESRQSLLESHEALGVGQGAAPDLARESRQSLAESYEALGVGQGAAPGEQTPVAGRRAVSFDVDDPPPVAGIRAVSFDVDDPPPVDKGQPPRRPLRTRSRLRSIFSLFSNTSTGTSLTTVRKHRRRRPKSLQRLLDDSPNENIHDTVTSPSADNNMTTQFIMGTVNSAVQKVSRLGYRIWTIGNGAIKYLLTVIIWGVGIPGLALLVLVFEVLWLFFMWSPFMTIPRWAGWKRADQIVWMTFGMATPLSVILAGVIFAYYCLMS